MLKRRIVASLLASAMRFSRGCSEHRIRSNYRDPNLSNGGGFDGTGMNWANRAGTVAHMKCS